MYRRASSRFGSYRPATKGVTTIYPFSGVVAIKCDKYNTEHQHLQGQESQYMYTITGQGHTGVP